MIALFLHLYIHVRNFFSAIFSFFDKKIKQTFRKHEMSVLTSLLFNKGLPHRREAVVIILKLKAEKSEGIKYG